MLMQIYTFLYKIRRVAAGVLVVAGLSLLSLLPPLADGANTSNAAQAAPVKTPAKVRAVHGYDGPNVVSSGMAMGLDELGASLEVAGAKAEHAVQVTVRAVYSGLRFVGVTSANSLKFVATTAARSVTFVGRGAYAGCSLVVHGMADGVLFAFRATGNLLGFFVTAPAMTALVTPADSNPVPIIEMPPAAPPAQQAVLAATQTAATAGEPQQHEAAHRHQTGAVWPMQGQITTLFGVPHWPYQPVHTGLDISSGQRSGVAPVTPFRPGRVIDVVHTNFGLGNHVVVDHGEGLTSVYAHLHSTAVQPGQLVDVRTIIGREGSTGVSTGPHLHLEIRLHGQPVDPRPYLNGRP